MPGGTLLVSRYVNWFPHFKEGLEGLGFPDVHVTSMDKDGLNMLVNELRPGYLIMDSNFYGCGTPFMVRQLLEVFPELNIAIVTIAPFSDSTATWFVKHGVKAYIKWADGEDELHYGLQCFLDGKEYVAHDVQMILDSLPEWPDIKQKATKRHREILLMLCRGNAIKDIEQNLHICKATVEYHIRELMKIFNCGGREELINTVHCLKIFSDEDLAFNDTGYNTDKLPDWVKTQRAINRGQRTKGNEQRARGNVVVRKLSPRSGQKAMRGIL
jgi:DNA-binding NarL/FixJ family response regulator